MKFSAFIAALLLTVGFVACGGENTDGAAGDTTVVVDTPATPPPPPAPPVTGDSTNMSDTAAHSDSM